MIFTRFNRDARQCVLAASEEVRLLGHDSIGDDALLLGILSSEDTLASRVLAEEGVDAEAVRHESEQMMSDSLASIGISLEDIRNELGDSFDMRLPKDRKIPFAPRAKKALEGSLREATGLGSKEITAAHILLAILRLDGSAVRLLGRLGVDPGALRERLLEAMQRENRSPGEV